MRARPPPSNARRARGLPAIARSEALVGPAPRRRSRAARRRRATRARAARRVLRGGWPSRDLISPQLEAAHVRRQQAVELELLALTVIETPRSSAHGLGQRTRSRRS